MRAGCAAAVALALLFVAAKASYVAAQSPGLVDRNYRSQCDNFYGLEPPTSPSEGPLLLHAVRLTSATKGCSAGLRRDLDNVFNYLADHHSRLKAVEDRVTALEGKTPGPNGGNAAPTPPNPAEEGRLAARVTALEDEVSGLKAQMARLKAPPESRVGQTVRAPFTVVDDRDNVLLHVGDGTPRLPDGVVISRLGGSTLNVPGITVRNNGAAVAQLGATRNESGGLVLARPGEAGSRIVLDASQSKIAIADGAGAVLALLVDDEAMGPTVAVLSPAGETLAGLSRNPGGGRVFANLPNSEPAFRGGAVGGSGDACIYGTKRGPVCLNTILPLR